MSSALLLTLFRRLRAPLRICLAIAGGLVLAAGASGASNEGAQKRVALVIANSNYLDNALPNPEHDGVDMCAVLKELNFDVRCVPDVENLAEFNAQVQKFGASLNRDSIGFFYYAGHGVQVNGTNYLIPTKARIRTKNDLDRQAFNVNKLLSTIKLARNEFNLLVLDACRLDPTAPPASKDAVRALAGILDSPPGLAPINESPIGTMVLYSTGDNDGAFDGVGRNSPFAHQLLANIREPGLTVETLIKIVTRGVMAETAEGGHAQVPFVYGSLTADFCFADCGQKLSLAEFEKMKAERGALVQEAQSAKAQADSAKSENRKILGEKKAAEEALKRSSDVTVIPSL